MSAEILIVEDEKDIRELVALNLEMLGFTVTRCEDGQAGLDAALNKRFDVILLDVMLPGIDGLQVCQRIRAAKNYVPILMLTAKNTEADRVMGLEFGADDYLTKPFSVLELQARVKALLRRVAMIKQDEPDADDLLVFGAWTIDKQKRTAVKNGEEVHFTAKEFDLLMYLSANPGRVYSREQLLDSVWGYQYSGYDHTVNSHINRLRAKIEDDPNKPQFVLTVWGVGYKFNDR